MKKIALIMALGLIATGALAGCGGSNESSSEAESSAVVSVAEDSATDSGEESTDNSSVVGNWTLSSIVSADGTSQTLEEYCAEQGVDSEGVQATYTFAEDGSAEASIGGIGTAMTYTFDGSTLTYTVTETGVEATMTYDADEDTLTSTDESTGVSSVCTRQ